LEKRLLAKSREGYEARQDLEIFFLILLLVTDPPWGRVENSLLREFSPASPDHKVTAGSPLGTAKGCGEDFHEKIFDCGGVHRNGKEEHQTPHQVF